MSTKQHKFERKEPEEYERNSVPRVFGPLAHAFLQEVPIQEGDRLLDLACGTGVLARRAAEIVGLDGHVKALDVNEGMLDVARGLPKVEGAEIEWHHGDASELPFEEEEFDGVLCQQGMQFFPDKVGALAEMYRVLKQGGYLGICTWMAANQSPYHAAVVLALKRHAGPEAAEQLQQRTPFSLGDAARIGELISGAGFRDVRVLPREIEVNRGMPEDVLTVAEYPELDAKVAELVVEDVRNDMQPYITVGGLVTPYRYNLAIARK